MNPLITNDTRLAVNYSSNVAGLHEGYQPSREDPVYKLTFNIHHTHPHTTTSELNAKSTKELTSIATSILCDLTSFCTKMNTSSISPQLNGLGMKHFVEDKLLFRQAVTKLREKNEQETAEILLNSFNSINCINEKS